MAITVYGLFDTLEDARNAIKALTEAGFQGEDISLLASDYRREYAKYVDDSQAVATDAGADAVSGAGMGTVVGTLTGLVAGAIGSLVIPGIGPVIFAGPLLSALAGAGVGAATGGLLGALMDQGVPEDQAGYYAEGVRRGGVLVIVSTREENASLVEKTLKHYNAVDLDRRVAAWRQGGWTGYDLDAEPFTPEEIEQERRRYR